MTTWSREKPKTLFLQIYKAYAPHIYQGEDEGPHEQSHVTHQHVVNGQIKNVIVPFSQGLWTPNLAGWSLRMRGPQLQSHVTHQPRGHVTNQKRNLSTFTRTMNPKLS